MAANDNRHGTDRHYHNARWFQVLCRFADTPAGNRQANAFMSVHTHAALLAIQDGELILADTRDNGHPIHPSR